jgi:predicted Zn finger-like uncharacterized protein
MYTQCSHCKAIFRVTMKELTAAQGLLRCGECDAVFDAMKSLSTTLPEERRFARTDVTPAKIPEYSTIRSNTTNPPPFIERMKALFQRKPIISTRSPNVSAKRHAGSQNKQNKKQAGSPGFLMVGVASLTLLLLLQLLYFKRNWLAQQPMTASVTQQVCHWLGCKLEVPRDVRHIALLSRNVYSHPNTPGVLTISVSIQNNAAFAQPYPLIEISFLTKNNQIMALRRFTPEEYIKDYAHETMPVGTPKELLLNITDPGAGAVSFKFRFI